jgi:hypothetical protein
MRLHKVVTALTVLFLATAGLDRLRHAAGPATARAAGDSRPSQRDAASARPSSSTPATPAELSPQLAALRGRLRGVLQHYAKRRLNTSEHNAWEAMHMVIAYGVKSEIRVGSPDGERQNAIGWLCFNRPFQGDRILTLENGRPIGVIGVGLQGHHGQLLAILAQAKLKRDYPMHVAGKSFKVEDLIENEKFTCRSGTELTFKLIAASHYLATDATWKNETGQTWSVSRLVREEIAAPIQGAACGGTHRLMGLAQAVRKRQKEGKPIDGEFARAQQYLQDYHHWAFRLQNPDGSFSTQWLEYRDARPDIERRLQTSGHILEWLAFSLSEEELRQPNTVRGVEYLTDLLASHRGRKWSIGPLGHGLHALALYDERVFRPLDEKAPAIEVHEEGPPPARDPRSASRSDAASNDAALARRLRLHHVQRSVAPPSSETAATDSSARGNDAAPKGPVLVSPHGALH